MIIGLKNRVHVQIFEYPIPVVQIVVKRAHPTVKSGQMGLIMGFLKGSKASLLGTTIVGLFDNMGKVWYFNYVMIRNVAF